MKQRIVVVDEKIRSIIEKDSDDYILKGIAQFSYKYAIAISIILVIIWPLPLYFSGYVFTFDMYMIWVGISIVWAIGGTLVIVFQPLIEARSSIAKVLRNMIYQDPRFVADSMYKNGSSGTISSEIFSLSKTETQSHRTVLVPVDGSLHSLKALNYASQMVGSFTGTRILVLNVIEWANDAEDSIDSELALKIEERGRRMLSSILLKNELDECERIVKLGDPVNKIAEVAERNHVEMIIMGARGLGNSSSDLGSISSRVVGKTCIPVLLIT
jgi:nucleotide-binding universal stress UspA family protein